MAFEEDMHDVTKKVQCKILLYLIDHKNNRSNCSQLEDARPI